MEYLINCWLITDGWSPYVIIIKILQVAAQPIRMQGTRSKYDKLKIVAILCFRIFEPKTIKEMLRGMPSQETLFGNACQDQGFDLIVDTSGVAEAIQQIFPLLNNGGETCWSKLGGGEGEEGCWGG